LIINNLQLQKTNSECPTFLVYSWLQ